MAKRLLPCLMIALLIAASFCIGCSGKNDFYKDSSIREQDQSDKEYKGDKDGKGKEDKEYKEGKEDKEDKENKEGKESKEDKEYKEGKEGKDYKKDKKDEKDKKDNDKPDIKYGSRPIDDDPNIVWSYIAEGSYIYYASPALSSDEKTVYFGTSFALKSMQSDKDRLIALNRDGTLKWEYSTQRGEVRSNITVYKDNLYFTADYGRNDAMEHRESSELIALGPDGRELWRKRIAGSSMTKTFGLSQVAAKDDKVLVVTDYLYVFNYLTGEEVDKHPINPNARMMSYIRPVVNKNSAYFLLDGALYEYNFDTSALDKKDLKDLPNWPKFSATNAIRFDSKDNMYVGCGSLLLSFDKDKNHRWTYDAGNENINFRSSPAIDEANGLLYIGTKNNEDSQILAIKLDTGKLAWAYDTGGDAYSSPALYNGLIYACAERGYMHILKPDGALVKKLFVNEEITWCSPVIDKQGILYIGGMGDGKSKGYIYAVRTIKPE